MIMDIQPGRIAEFEGRLHLIESVKIEVVMQRIEPLKPLLDRNEGRWDAGDFDHNEVHNPCFCRLQGSLDDEVFQHPRFKLLYPDGEPE